jgi:hypothetical protein
VRERAFDALPRVSHFDDQHAASVEPRRRFRQDAPNQIQSVAPAGERKRRLVAVFRR